MNTLIIYNDMIENANLDEIKEFELFIINDFGIDKKNLELLLRDLDLDVLNSNYVHFMEKLDYYNFSKMNELKEKWLFSLYDKEKYVDINGLKNKPFLYDFIKFDCCTNRKKICILPPSVKKTLHIASILSSTHYYCIKYALSKIEDPETLNNLLLKSCDFHNNYNIVKILLESYNNGTNIDVNVINKKGKSPLYLACVRGNTEIVKLLLQFENLAHNVEMPFFEACCAGHVEIVRLLLETKCVRAQVEDNGGNTGFMIACSKGHVKIVELFLLFEKHDVINIKNNDGMTGFWKAVENGHIAIAKLLIKNTHAEINTKNRYGDSLLYIACSKGNLALVKLLLGVTNIDVDIKNRYGCTPFSIACSHGYTEIVKILLETKNVDVNVNVDGWYRNTLFLTACIHGYVEIVKMLLETKNVDVNAKNIHGDTPLLAACARGYVEIVKMLLETKNVDVNVKNECGNTPYSRAVHGKYDEIKKLLLETNLLV